MSRFCLLACLLLAGCQASDSDTLRKLARKTGEKLETAAGPAGGMARATFGEGSVSARVEARLRWDRALAEQRISVRAVSRGEVTLSGYVADAAAKDRAAELAKSTLGVEKVNDEVKVGKEMK